MLPGTEPLNGTARRAFVIALVTGLALLTVKLAPVIVLIFGAIVVATMFRAIADPLERRGVPNWLAVLLAVVIVFAAFAISSYVFGDRVGAQLRELSTQLPGAYDTAKARLLALPLGPQLVEGLNGLGHGGDVFGRITKFALGTIGTLTTLILVIVGGIYLAIAPDRYARGLKLLFPAAQRPALDGAFNAVGHRLKGYLLGVAISMLLVGVFVTIGLSFIGMPSALALGLISGTTEFVPLVGGFLGAIPGVLLGLSRSPEMGLKAAAVYLVVQLFQSNGVSPLIHQRVVSIPPALLLFAVLAMNLLFGTPGVVLAAPLTVALYTLVEKLWVERNAPAQVQ